MIEIRSVSQSKLVIDKKDKPNNWAVLTCNVPFLAIQMRPLLTNTDLPRHLVRQQNCLTPYRRHRNQVVKNHDWYLTLPVFLQTACDLYVVVICILLTNRVVPPGQIVNFGPC